MKKLLSSLFILLTMVVCAIAQERTVTGTVTDGEDGSPLPGVSVRVKGTTTGTQTGIDGKYSVRIPAGSNTLTFTYIGYATKDVVVGGNNTVDVALESDTKQLGEVVVTALGLTRREKSLGYSATTIKAEDITAASSINAMSGIQGKVAGVSISNTGTVGGSTKVVIRGVSSFVGGNNPLYVVDGVPINNAFRGAASDDLENMSKSPERTVDYGNQANDINPEDIESVTILKGASATALYGTRAAHGVVMITTKSGKLNQKLQVTYAGSFQASNVLRTPQTQRMFGQGWPIYDLHENGSWGPKLDGRVRTWGTEIDGVSRTKPYSYVKNNVRNFFDTGVDFSNSISISAGGQNNAFALSYSNTGQNGIVPTDADRFTRNTISLRGNSKYGRFEGNYSINYIRKDQHAVFAGQGSSDGGASLYQDMIATPVDVPISEFKDYTNPYNDSDNFYDGYDQNPYFILNSNGAKFQDDHVLGRIELSYGITNNLKAIGRIGGDFSNTQATDWAAIVNYTPGSLSDIYSKQEITGRYGENYRKDGQIDAQLLLNGNYNLNSDISLNATAGFNYNQRTANVLDSYVTGLNINGWRSLSNANTLPTSSSASMRRRLMGALGQIDLGFKDFWYVNVSLRNDWSSTLPVDKNSFFYWGANTSLLLTDMFKNLQSQDVNLLKLRVAWGQTGNDAPPYRVLGGYTPSQVLIGYGYLYLPLNGVAGLTESNRLGNLNLKPEITTEFELGADTRFFNNRLSLDASYYNRHTKDQIISASYAAETGYTSQTLNVGDIQNQGIEALLSIVPVKTQNWQWEFSTNFTKNVSKVNSLYGDTKEFVVTSAYDVDYVAEVGESFGTFKVPDLLYVEEGPNKGKVIVDATGKPKTNPNSKLTVGSSQPDFIVGFTNSIKYKNFSLSAAVDWRQGGKFYSYTKQLNNFVGNSTETTFNERQPFVYPNSVKEVVNGGVTTYVENDVPITYGNTYDYWGDSNPAQFKNFILDRSYVKLREVVLTYSLPTAITSRLKLAGADISLIGRNLLLFTPKSNNFVDPEGSNYGNDIYSEFGEFAASPTTRNFGASLRVRF